MVSAQTGLAVLAACLAWQLAAEAAIRGASSDGKRRRPAKGRNQPALQPSLRRMTRRRCSDPPSGLRTPAADSGGSAGFAHAHLHKNTRAASGRSQSTIKEMPRAHQSLLRRRMACCGGSGAGARGPATPAPTGAQRSCAKQDEQSRSLFARAFWSCHNNIEGQGQKPFQGCTKKASGYAPSAKECGRRARERRVPCDEAAVDAGGGAAALARHLTADQRIRCRAS